MIGMIAHLGKVRPRRGLTCALWHLVGTTLGAGVLGALLGGVGMLLGGVFEILYPGLSFREHARPWLGVLAITCGLVELRILDLPLPQRRRQVSQELWYSLGPRRAALLWGTILGFGLTTWVSYPVYYSLLAAATFASPPILGGLMLAVCGFGQGLTTMVWTACPARPTGDPRFESKWSDGLHHLAGATALAIGVYLIALSLNPRNY